jgi:hypothetical protein
MLGFQDKTNVVLSRGGQRDHILFIEGTRITWKTSTEHWTPAAHNPKRHSENPPEPTGRANCRVLPVALNNDAWKDPSWQTNTPTEPPEGNAQCLTPPQTPEVDKTSCQQTRERINPRMRLSERINRPPKARTPLPGVSRPLKARMTSQRRPLIDVGLH